MKKTILSLLCLCFTFIAFSQPNDNLRLIEWAKAYKDFMFRNEPTKQVVKDLEKGIPEHLQKAGDFLLQTIATQNKLLSSRYLTRPDDQTLKQLYIIRAVNLNLREEAPVDNNKLIDSLANAPISPYALLDNYYGMLFTAVGNKNQPFDFSKVDFNLKAYNLRDDAEKGILVLRSMDFCGRTIWGYMNIVKPANTKEAYRYIKKFPSFNGRPFYQYSDFYFPDFEMEIIKDKGLQSYKRYYLDKFYETLLSYLICLHREGGSEKEKNDLLLGSVLKERNLYQYTRYKETLEGIFKEQKTE